MKMVSSLLLLHLAASPTLALPSTSAPRQNTFQHPGIFVSQAQLDSTKAHLAAKANPWRAAYSALDDLPWTKPSWGPSPVATVRCEDPGTPEHDQEQGCEEERLDALAAYSLALRWAYTGNDTYAAKAITIIDAWSGTLKEHVSSSAPEQPGLQSGWAASTWTRAAEILRYTDANWDTGSITRFSGILRDVYLPLVRDGSADNPNNIDSAMLEAAQNIAVFLEDRTLYDAVMERAKLHIASYIYLKSDGSFPKIPEWTTKYLTEARVRALWQSDGSFFDGRTMETCRDLEHASYGLASISHMFETARIQGEDLYTTGLGSKLQTALEMHAQYAAGGPVSSEVCGGQLKYELLPVAEPGYAQFVGRLGRSMPKTKAFVEGSRPAKPNYLFTAWETLTHAS
ncbi:uncharacterized protein N0V89_008843 [Didymosphaeria variabile]|uniref:Alginate lyase domain-containing protein n=1 Tax=Didymosphaeria variabile TaxID=1932322 RepID=A0A9W8XIC3_9PLEO|nr:uncharacterized protein N0V89_008843 [Didymosphaeria variabile]KAJ4350222.1 hypothetical protein N0V89_008843 [Didymosphaeria variabile]